MEEKRSKRVRQVAEALMQVEAVVASVWSSEAWEEWLKALSKFHSYSLGNCLLIMAQRPGARRDARGAQARGFQACVRL